MKLAGSLPWNQLTGLEPTGGVSNYLRDADSKASRANIPHYARLRAGHVYDGIDLVFYGRGGNLEYDFVVAPGADPKAIALNVRGASKMSVDEAGNLIVSVPQGKVQFEKPIIYQEVNGEKRLVAGNYKSSDKNDVSFAVADYDHSKPLIIDPVLNYSTYLAY